jgi:4-diphosphocytidyl-2-C-methyl-D-erythritol kinase
MKIRAYAKINIGLHILGKRPDGFHNLETIFREIDLYDEIRLQPADKIAMNADSILVPIDASNLCMKAAQLLQKEKRIKKGVEIFLVKKIPLGAGLGGGSSDAASVLRGLNKMWKLNLSDNDLRALAGQLGADVPFFITGGNAYATGRGEILYHFDLDIPYWITLVTPPVHISTAWAYNGLKLTRNGRPTGFQQKIEKQMRKPQELPSLIQNDFEPSIFRIYPKIKETKEKLMQAGALFSMMTGSGSSVFGFFKNEQKAKDVRTLFPAGYQVTITAPSFAPDHEPEID